MVNLCATSEVPMFIGYNDIKGNAKWIKWGDLEWLRVTRGHIAIGPVSK